MNASPSELLYRARELEAAAQAARVEADDAWAAYEAERWRWLPPDVALATDPAPAHVGIPGRRVVQRKYHTHAPGMRS